MQRLWKIVAVTFVAGGAAASGGCATQAGTGALAGGGIGAGLGALVGSATGNPRAGAAIGGVLGAGVGTAVGADADAEKANRANDLAVAQANAAEANAPASRGPLSIDDVVRMSKADGRVSDDVIVNYIRTSNSVYNLQPQDLQYLSANGVSERVIIEMNNTRNRTPTRIVAEPRTRTVIVREPAPYYYDPYYPGPVFMRPAPPPAVFIRARF